jgi:hypothetical protein
MSYFGNVNSTVTSGSIVVTAGTITAGTLNAGTINSATITTGSIVVTAGTMNLRDVYGFTPEFTPMDEFRVVTPYRLVGATFNGTSIDANYWTAGTGTGGTAAVGNAQLSLNVGTTANNTTNVQSVRTARYIGAASNRFRAQLRLPDAGTVNNTRRWGAFGTTDGAFFELAGSAFGVITRKTSNDSTVASGAFNGNMGATFVPGTNTVYSYEIYWTNSKVYYVVGGALLHTFSAVTTSWADSMNLPARVENNNANGGTSNVGFNVRVMTIIRLGAEQTQPVSKFFNALGTTTCKNGPGNLHAISLSGVANSNIVQLYDSIGTSASVIWHSGAQGANAVPYSVDLKNTPFFTGLTLSMAGGTANVTLIYE